VKIFFAFFISLLCLVVFGACSNKETSVTTTTTTEAFQESIETTNNSPRESRTTTGSSQTDIETTTETPLLTLEELVYTTIAFDRESLPEYVPGSVKLLPRRLPSGSEYPSFEKFDRKYRLVYYSDFPVYQLLSPEQSDEWMRYKESSYWFKYGKEEYEEMEIVRLIKYFNLPKDAVDERIQYWKNRREESPNKPGSDDYLDYSLEGAELPNTDIIYTFDNEIINRYYRYE
jgi:hypothetical protein